MEPQVTISLSEYNKLLRRPFYQVDKENKILKKWLINSVPGKPGSGTTLSLGDFMQLENVHISIASEGRRASPEDVKIRFK